MGSEMCIRDRLQDVFASATANTLPQIDSGSDSGTKAKSTSKYPRITLRLTEEENTQLRELASGVTVSSYVRECLFGKGANTRKTRQRHKPVADEQSLARALAMLGETRIANNLNQLAHRANMGELRMNDTTLAQIEEAYAHIQSMRSTLIEAIGLIEST